MTDQEMIIENLKSMYKAFEDKDRQKFDLFLDETVTTWESPLPTMLLNKGELDRYRDGRDASGSRPEKVTLSISEEVVTVLGNVGLARYIFKVEVPNTEPLLNRVTDVLTKSGSNWKIIHHHCEKMS
jgi:ketosteroid isomerase-like protein